MVTGAQTPAGMEPSTLRSVVELSISRRRSTARSQNEGARQGVGWQRLTQSGSSQRMSPGHLPCSVGSSSPMCLDQLPMLRDREREQRLSSGSQMLADACGASLDSVSEPGSEFHRTPVVSAFMVS